MARSELKVSRKKLRMIIKKLVEKQALDEKEQEIVELIRGGKK